MSGSSLQHLVLFQELVMPLNGKNSMLDTILYGHPTVGSFLQARLVEHPRGVAHRRHDELLTDFESPPEVEYCAIGFRWMK